MRETFLIVHFIGLAMGLGVSITHAFLGKAISKMDKNEAAKFKSQIKILSRMGAIGIILLLVSGIYLIIPFWPAIMAFPLLILKLVLFVILVTLIILINLGAKKNFKNATEGNTNRIELMGKLALIIGVVIVILAVNIFH